MWWLVVRFLRFPAKMGIYLENLLLLKLNTCFNMIDHIISLVFLKLLYWFFSHCSQVSTNILRKYIGPVDIWFSMLLAMRYTNGVVHCLVNKHPQMGFHAMAQHSSQWVWYVCYLNY